MVPALAVPIIFNSLWALIAMVLPAAAVLPTCPLITPMLINTAIPTVESLTALAATLAILALNALRDITISPILVYWSVPSSTVRIASVQEFAKNVKEVYWSLLQELPASPVLFPAVPVAKSTTSAKFATAVSL